MGKNLNLMDWHYYRNNWKPKRLRSRGPPKWPIVKLDQALDRLNKLRHGSCSHLLMYADLLRQCGNQGALYHGQRVHAHIIDHGLISNAFLGELVFQMYARCGWLEAAQALFESMPERRVYCWNVLIEAYNRSDHPLQALRIYKRMSAENVQPDDSVFCSVLVSCARLRDLREGRAIHYRISTGYQPSSYVHCALIKMYAKCSRIDLAKCAFDWVEERDVLVWNAMITAYSLTEDFGSAVSLYRIMTEEVEPDAITFTKVLAACACIEDLTTGTAIHMLVKERDMISYINVQNALVKMYGKCNRIEEARRVFEEIPNRNVASWSSIIAAYGEREDYRAALELYQRMDVEEVDPDEKILIVVSDAIASLGGAEAIDLGRRLHSKAAACGVEDDAAVQKSLVKMYIRCGCLDEAMQVFERIKPKNRTAEMLARMSKAYFHKGNPLKAVELFKEMQQRGSQS